MIAYIYKPQDIGLTRWPEGELRLEGVEQTTDPEAADIFICPGSLALFRDPPTLYKLPHFKGNEAKHVFLDVSDFETQYHQQSLFIRCNLRKFNLDADPNSIQMAWPVEDYSECIDVPEGGFKFEVSGHMWLSSATRRQSFESVKGSTLKCDLAGYSDFTGYIFHEPEGIRRRTEFRRSMRESRVALCPESIPGVFPYRFFEAMSAGRVPVLVGEEFIYPFASDIPYSDFTCHIGRKEASMAGPLIAEFLKNTSDRELILKGKLARFYWSKLLNRELWPATMAYAVRTALGKAVGA